MSEQNKAYAMREIVIVVKGKPTGKLLLSQTHRVFYCESVGMNMSMFIPCTTVPIAFSSSF